MGKGKNIYHITISSLQGAVLFGAPFCAIYAVLYRNLAKEAALGALSGFLYGLGIFAYGISQDREGEGFYGRIAEKEEILHYAPANMFISRNISVGGRLCLTGDAIHFRETGFFSRGNGACIPLSDIVEASPAGRMNCINVMTRDGGVATFAVHGRKRLIAMINTEAAARSREENAQARGKGGKQDV